MGGGDAERDGWVKESDGMIEGGSEWEEGGVRGRWREG